MKFIWFQRSVPHYRIKLFKSIFSSKLDFSLISAKSNIDDDFPIIPCENINYIGKIDRIFGFMRFHYGVRFSKIIKTCDVCILDSNWRNVHNIFIMTYCYFYKKRVIMFGQFNKETIFQLAFKKLCSHVADALITYYPEPRYARTSKNIFALKNGLDASNIDNLVEPYDAKDRKDIIYVGRLTEKSKVLEVIKLAVKFKETGAKIHIVGEGELFEELKHSIELNDIQNVILHGSIYEEHKLSILFNKSKLFVYPGKFGLSLIHSMFYGVPSVVLHSKEYA